jgi:hypothetical protein
MPDLVYEDGETDLGLSGSGRPDLEVLELGDARPHALERAFAFGLGQIGKILGTRLDLEGAAGRALEDRLHLATNIPVVGALVAEVALAGQGLHEAGRSRFARPVLAAYVNVLGAFSRILPARRAALAEAARRDLAAV